MCVSRSIACAQKSSSTKHAPVLLLLHHYWLHTHMFQRNASSPRCAQSTVDESCCTKRRASRSQSKRRRYDGDRCACAFVPSIDVVCVHFCSARYTFRWHLYNGGCSVYARSDGSTAVGGGKHLGQAFLLHKKLAGPMFWLCTIPDCTCTIGKESLSLPK